MGGVDWTKELECLPKGGVHLAVRGSLEAIGEAARACGLSTSIIQLSGRSTVGGAMAAAAEALVLQYEYSEESPLPRLNTFLEDISDRDWLSHPGGYFWVFVGLSTLAGIHAEHSVTFVEALAWAWSRWRACDIYHPDIDVPLHLVFVDDVGTLRLVESAIESANARIRSRIRFEEESEAKGGHLPRSVLVPVARVEGE